MHLYCLDANSCAFSSLLEDRFPVLGGRADSKILRRDCFRSGVIFLLCVYPTSVFPQQVPKAIKDQLMLHALVLQKSDARTYCSSF